MLTSDATRPITPADDPLLRGLSFLSRHHGRPVSPEQLGRSLPLEGGIVDDKRSSWVAIFLWTASYSRFSVGSCLDCDLRSVAYEPNS